MLDELFFLGALYIFLGAKMSQPPPLEKIGPYARELATQTCA